jgi:hypothetical protein
MSCFSWIAEMFFLARTATRRDDIGNNVYVQSFAETDHAAATAVFWIVFYGIVEPVNSNWFEPNL